MASKRMSISSLLSIDPPPTPTRTEPPTQPPTQSPLAQVSLQPTEPPLKRPRRSSASQQHYGNYNPYSYEASNSATNSTTQQSYYQTPSRSGTDQLIRPSSPGSNMPREHPEYLLESAHVSRQSLLHQLPSPQEISPYPMVRGEEYTRDNRGYVLRAQVHPSGGVSIGEDRWTGQGANANSLREETGGAYHGQVRSQPHSLVQATLPPPQLRREAASYHMQRQRQQEGPLPSIPAVLDSHISRRGSTSSSLPGQHSSSSTVHAHIHPTPYSYTSLQASNESPEYSGSSPVRSTLGDFARFPMRHEGETHSRSPTQLIPPLSLSNLPRQVPPSPTMAARPYQSPPAPGSSQQFSAFAQQSRLSGIQHNPRVPASPLTSPLLAKGHTFSFPRSASPQAQAYPGMNAPRQPPLGPIYRTSEAEQGPPLYSRGPPETDARRPPSSRASDAEPRRPLLSRTADPPRPLSSRSMDSPRSRPSSSRECDFVIPPPPPPNPEFGRSPFAHQLAEPTSVRSLRDMEHSRSPTRDLIKPPISREAATHALSSRRPEKVEPSPSSPSLKSPASELQRTHTMSHLTSPVDLYQIPHTRVPSPPLPSPRIVEAPTARSPHTDPSAPGQQAAAGLSQSGMWERQSPMRSPSIRALADIPFRSKSSPESTLLPDKPITDFVSPLQKGPRESPVQTRPSLSLSPILLQQQQQAHKIETEQILSPKREKSITYSPDARISSLSPLLSKRVGLEERPSPQVIAMVTSVEGTPSKAEPDEHAFEEELLSLVGDAKAQTQTISGQLVASPLERPQPSRKTPASGSSTPVKAKGKRAAPKNTKAKAAAARQQQGDSAASSPQPPKARAPRTKNGTAGSRRKATAVARARSQSVKPSEETPAPEPEPEPQIEKQYCICKQPYEEDRVMIACDRCDEWYHPNCVDMPESEVDLVDQFICVNCVKGNPSLRTTYKTRCSRGIHHIASHDDKSPCWKPARGAFSKYCSDACGIAHMRAKIAQAGHDPAELWPVLKSARKRGGVTIEHPNPNKHKRCKTGAMDLNGENNTMVSGAITKATSLTHIRRLHQSIDGREVNALQQHLANVIRTREECKGALDRVATRRRLLDLAVERASKRFCGWDARLEMGDSEWAEWVDTPAGRKALAGEESDSDEEASSWWCQISDYCQRHADWQRVRDVEMQLEVDSKNASIKQLTDKERDLRRRIDELDPSARGANKRRTAKRKHGLKSSVR